MGDTTRKINERISTASAINLRRRFYTSSKKNVQSRHDWRNIEGIEGKLRHVLAESLFTDMTIVVEPDKGREKTFKVHRLILAIQSPVFESMFFGNSNATTVIRITDTTPTAFEAFLKYHYCDHRALSELSILELNDVWFVAVKYQSQSLVDSVKRHLKLSVHSQPLNALLVLEMALLMQDDTMLNVCLEAISQNMASIMQTKEFLSLNKRVLEKILQQDDVGVPEIDLWNSVVKWGTGKVKKSEKDPGVIREALHGVIEHMRFLSMDAETFKEGPGSSGILREQESMAILQRMSSDSEKMPKKFNATIRKGSKNDIVGQAFRNYEEI